MGRATETMRSQKARLEAYSKARPLVEQFKDDPLALQSMVEIAWEFLAETGHHVDIMHLVQDGLNHVSLGFQKLESRAITESGEISSPKLVVGWNRAPATCDCSVCGRPGVEREEGPELFIDGGDVICDKCAEKHGPELVGLLRIFRKNHAFVSALKEMIKKSPPEHGGDVNKDFGF
jgi:hypothetical protein